jgi:uncharacterized protein (DUF58 family)
MTDTAALRPKAEALAAPLPPLLVAASRIAATVIQGVHGRRRIGRGDAFWQFRPYQIGDAPQRIDWRQTAKGRDIFIRETEWEAAQSVWLWRDSSPSMAYSGHKDRPHKQERAELLLMALAILLNEAGERVGLLGHRKPPGQGKAAMERLFLSLAETPEESLPPEHDIPRHGRVVLMSDFLEPLDALKARIGGLAERGVRGHMMMILDPSEAVLSFKGRILFKGLENEGEMLARRAEGLKDLYDARLAAQIDGLEQIARASGWSFARHHTDQPATTALMALFLALTAPEGDI